MIFDAKIFIGKVCEDVCCTLYPVFLGLLYLFILFVFFAVYGNLLVVILWTLILAI